MHALRHGDATFTKRYVDVRDALATAEMGSERGIGSCIERGEEASFT
jgi:hypothetical protein